MLLRIPVALTDLFRRAVFRLILQLIRLLAAILAHINLLGFMSIWRHFVYPPANTVERPACLTQFVEFLRDPNDGLPVHHVVGPIAAFFPPDQSGLA